jgi:hypothetical protein
MVLIISAEKSSRRERLISVDLLVIISLDKFLCIFDILFTFFTKQATLMESSTVMSRHERSK